MRARGFGLGFGFEVRTSWLFFELGVLVVHVIVVRKCYGSERKASYEEDGIAG